MIDRHRFHRFAAGIYTNVEGYMIEHVPENHGWQLYTPEPDRLWMNTFATLRDAIAAYNEDIR